jgi:hypothetical protein
VRAQAKAYVDSVGRIPWYAFQVAFGSSVLLLLLLVAVTHRHGPSFEVRGLHDAATVAIHRNDDAYALALSRRFTQQYHNWSYQTHLRSKLQAAYLCSASMQSVIRVTARAKDPGFRQLRMVSSARILSAAVTWSDPARNLFQVELELEVTEWLGYVESRYQQHGVVQLGASTGPSGELFGLEVTGFRFKPTSEVIRVENATIAADLSIEDLAIQMAEQDLAQDAASASAAGSEPVSDPLTPIEADPSADIRNTEP